MNLSTKSSLLRIRRNAQASQQRQAEENEQGATLLEFAIVIPLLLFTVLALFDFVRYLTIQGILNSAANRAVSLASVIEDLDTDCRRLPPAQRVNCGTRRLDAIEKVLKVAQDLPLETMLGTDVSSDRAYLISEADPNRAAIEFIISEDKNLTAKLQYGTDAPSARIINFDADEPNVQALSDILQNEPVEVRIRARVDTFFPFLGELNVEGHAAGFREPRFLTSFPARLDCRGRPVGPGGETPVDCPCSTDPDNPTLLDDGSGSCICDPGIFDTVEEDGVIRCICKAGDTFDIDEGGNCFCPYTTAEELGCAAGQIFDADACRCDDCPGQNTSTDGIACSCPVSSAAEAGCGPEQIFDAEECDCVGCPFEQVANADGRACECPFANASEAGCTGTEVFDSENCKCNPCPYEQVADSTGEVCECPPDFLSNNECGPGDRVDVDQCRCRDCPGEQTGTPDGTSCECTLTVADCNPDQRLDIGKCRCRDCPGESEASGDGTSCVCELDPNTCFDNGEEFRASACECRPCPGAQVLLGSSCGCPDIVCAGGNINSSACACECPGDEVLIGGSACGPIECLTTDCIIGPDGASIPE